MDERKLEERLSAIEKSLEMLQAGMALIIGTMRTDPGNDLAGLIDRHPREPDWHGRVNEIVRDGKEFMTIHAPDAMKEAIKNP